MNPVKIHFPSLLKETGKSVTAFRIVIFEQVIIDRDSGRTVMDSVDLHHLAQSAFSHFLPVWGGWDHSSKIVSMRWL